MCPTIWIFDMYSVMMFLGIIAALVVYYIFAKKNNFSTYFLLTILIDACIAVVVGILAASGVQVLLNYMNHQENILSGMTFYGGLFGGALAFIIAYMIFNSKEKHKYSFMDNVLVIAPASITLAHSIGRIGCFMAGCCYGKETDSFIGVVFPFDSIKRVPTQLIESVFLFVLFLVLFILAMKKKSKYTMPIYLLSYSIFRFFIEFLRDDERGLFIFNLSPAQIISILVFISSIVLFIFIFNKYKRKEELEN